MQKQLEIILIKLCEQLPFNITLFEKNGLCYKPSDNYEYYKKDNFCYKKTYSLNLKLINL